LQSDAGHSITSNEAPTSHSSTIYHRDHHLHHTFNTFLSWRRSRRVQREPASEIIEEFRADEGRVGGPFYGASVPLLHTTRAKSGATRAN
jgi:hypothetical protein